MDFVNARQRWRPMAFAAIVLAGLAAGVASFQWALAVYRLNQLRALQQRRPRGQ